eukprot:9488414-Pyramimonas_sp.AAC.1
MNRRSILHPKRAFSRFRMLLRSSGSNISEGWRAKGSVQFCIASAVLRCRVLLLLLSRSSGGSEE